MMSFAEFDASVRTYCGHYYSVPDFGTEPTHDFQLQKLHGFDVAVVDCTVKRIERKQSGINKDDVEHLFLLHQTKGKLGVQFDDSERLLQPGDFLLLDSTMPVDLVANGKHVQFKSVHLPKSLFSTNKHARVAPGRTLSSTSPLHPSMKKLLDLGDDVNHAELFLDYIALAFAEKAGVSDFACFQRRDARIHHWCELIDRNLKETRFSIDQFCLLAACSKRQLQRELNLEGTNFTRLLQSRRLKHAITLKQQADKRGKGLTMARISQLSGFSDQAHFNRVFRQHFNLSPREYFSTSR